MFREYLFVVIVLLGGVDYTPTEPVGYDPCPPPPPVVCEYQGDGDVFVCYPIDLPDCKPGQLCGCQQ